MKNKFTPQKFTGGAHKSFDANFKTVENEPQMTGLEALEKIKIEGLVEMANCSRYNTQVIEIVKLIMILVYAEKEKTTVENFNQKLFENGTKEGPGQFLQFVKTVTRTPVDWQLKMLEPTLNKKWMNYDGVKTNSETAALWTIWIREQYENGFKLIDQQNRRTQ